MNRFLSLFGLPPVGDQTALHIDLATLCIAIVAGAFSVYAFFHQRDIKATRITGIELQRDRLVIAWIQLAIDTVVSIEFLLRGWSPAADAQKFLLERDEQLAKLAAVIDKGQFYFPDFEIIALELPGQATQGVQSKVSDGGSQPSLLSDLVAIYKLTKGTELEIAKMKRARDDVLLKKLEFIKLARSAVEITNLIRSRREKTRIKP